VSTASALVPYVQDAKQKSWLENLIAKENRDNYKKQIEIPRRSFISLICRELSSCKIPLPDLLHILPYVQPRYYTISSSSTRFPDTVHITVSVTEYETEDKLIFKGLASTYLKVLIIIIIYLFIYSFICLFI